MKNIKYKTVNHHLLSPKQVFWILLSVVISIVPHLPRLPIWFGILLILVVISRWLVAIKKIQAIPQWLIVFLTLMLTLVIIYFQGFKLDREISVTVLATMTVLKLLETWRKRDAWMVVTLCYFVILTRFFYSQDMLLILYLLLSVIVITHTLYVIQHNNKNPYLIKQEIKQTLGLLLAGVPLAALFFLFFPRLGAPIWGSPDFFGQGKTGMSEEMSPGSISQLFSDDSTAFRVNFKGNIPPNNQLYWRGPVLWDFDGSTWTINKQIKPTHKDQSFQQKGTIVDYQVELEPTGQHYLFALDYLTQAPEKLLLYSDSQLKSKIKINQLSHYHAKSVLKKYNPFEWLSHDALNRLTQLPRGYNPKTLKMMQQWRAQSSHPEQLINKVLQLFATDKFYYSYSPPLLSGDTVDQFLFETKTGFCEHYASAFTVMMRAAGLPARVVTGYQGGILNKDYFLVKQSDAHAWSEVWIKGKGWLRVDPTAAVSPERVEKGSQALMNEKSRNWHDSSWYRKLGERYDRMRYKWNKWVRDYNVVKQKALFKVFGFDSQNGKTIALVLGMIMIATTLIVLLFLYLTRPRRILNHYDKIYQQFVALFKKSGPEKADAMSATEFAQQVINTHPQAKAPVKEFTQLYLKLRFSQHKSKQAILDKRLLQLIDKTKTQLNS